MNFDLINRAELPTVCIEIPKRLDDETCNIISEICKAFKLAIDSAPAIDAEPVRHGRWMPVGYDDMDAGMFRCSECSDERYFGDEVYMSEEASKYCRFCPECGAKMDGET